MTDAAFDYTRVDPWSMSVQPVEPAAFDFARYEAFALAADERYAEFMAKDEGIMVWQRVRAADVFRAGCRDMAYSLRLQMGCLTQAMDCLTDAPAYLEPWYGIGTIGSAFGGEYFWAEGQSPAMEPMYQTLEDVPDNLAPMDFADVPIMQHTLKMIEYFLAESQGRLPMSWCDIQNPLDISTELMSTTAFMMGFYTNPEKIKRILRVLTDTLIAFTQCQSDLIGACLARPGHGFASSRRDTGLAMSSDNIIMISPDAFAEFCAAENGRVGAVFGGVGIHSCGNWAKWIDVVQQIPNIAMLDAAFSAQMDPTPNDPADWADKMANTGIVLHARPGRDPEIILAQAKKLWRPGLKLIVVSGVEDRAAQHKLYHDLHNLCR
ncbi:uroporphyrinogen decarboxylase family protein [Chloroflexota bacterium]